MEPNTTTYELSGSAGSFTIRTKGQRTYRIHLGGSFGSGTVAVTLGGAALPGPTGTALTYTAAGAHIIDPPGGLDLTYTLSGATAADITATVTSNPA
jgi:hypothetical protein